MWKNQKTPYINPSLLSKWNGISNPLIRYSSKITVSPRNRML